MPLLVPDAADWAVMHMIAEHGGVSRAVVHRDPAIQAEIEQLHARVPFNPDMSYGPAEVMRTGTPVFVPRISLEGVNRIASSCSPDRSSLAKPSMPTNESRSRERIIRNCCSAS